MLLYATLCGLLVGLRAAQATLARRHVPRTVVRGSVTEATTSRNLTS